MTKGRNKAAKQAAKRGAAKLRAKVIAAHAAADPRQPSEDWGVGPTPERLAKPDIRKNGTMHIAEDLLDRLFRQHNLDACEDINRLMYGAGKRYQEAVHKAGLAGIGGQDLLRVAAGSGDAAHMMPTSEASAAARNRVRKAWTLLGFRVAPTIHRMLVEGVKPEEEGRISTAYSDKAQAIAAALTIFRLGLCDLSDNLRKWA